MTGISPRGRPRRLYPLSRLLFVAISVEARPRQPSTGRQSFRFLLFLHRQIEVFSLVSLSPRVVDFPPPSALFSDDLPGAVDPPFLEIFPPPRPEKER